MSFTEKLLTVPPPVEVAGRHIKRYHVTADPEGIAADVQDAAYKILPTLLPDPDGTPPATFVVLHRGGDDGAYLNAYSWTWDNVLHLRFAAAGAPGPRPPPTATPRTSSGRTNHGSAASGSCRRSCTNGTPGCGTCSRPTSPT